MKNKRLIIIALVFFLIVNTTYFWDGTLGQFSFPVLLSLFLFWIGLFGALVIFIFKGISENFSYSSRLGQIAILTIILSLTYYKPYGLFNDFKYLTDNNLLIAQREGSANCLTTFTLNNDNTFRERNVCFGVTTIDGTYKIKNDTIYFESVQTRKKQDVKYEFGIIEQTEFYTEHQLILTLFKNKYDTLGFTYPVVKYELNLSSPFKAYR